MVTMARASEHSLLPDRFDFTKPEEWPVWLRQFERYLRANDITSEQRQIDRLLLALGSFYQNMSGTQSATVMHGVTR